MQGCSCGTTLPGQAAKSRSIFLNGLSVCCGALTSLRRHARLGLHQIADDVGRFDERALREACAQGSEVVLACGTIFSYLCGGGVSMAGKISISITDEHAAVVQEAVRSGAYASSSEVIREALREWRAKRVVGELWDEGLASGRCDDGLSIADIKREARRRLTGN